MKKYILTIILPALLLQPALAQQPAVSGYNGDPAMQMQRDNPAPGKRWTLAECIAWAQENNIQILQQELSAKDAEQAAQQTRLNYIPSLSASVNSGSYFGSSYDAASENVRDDYTNMSGSVSLSTDLFNGLKKYHSLKRSDLSLKETLLSIDKVKNDLALNVTAVYLDILFAEERVRIAQSQITTLETQVDNSSKLVDAGKGTVGDLLQMQAQLAEARHQKLVADNQLVIGYFNLCQFLEIDDFQSFRIITPESLSVPVDIRFAGTDEIIDAAQSLPQIEGAKLGVDIAGRDISIAKADYYPTLRLSAGYGSGFEFNAKKTKALVSNPDPNDPTHWGRASYSIADQLRDRGNFNISLGLSIPIFNSFQTRNNVRTKRIALQRADYGLMIAQKQLGKDVQQAYIDATGALEQYNASLSNVETNEESFRMVQQKFDIGAATPVDYNVALNNLTQARSQLSQAKYEFIFKSKILDFYKGIPIDLR